MGNTQMPVPATALDHESTIVTAVELSASSWLMGAQVPSVLRQCRHKLAPSAEALLEHLGRLRQRAERAGRRVSRVVVAYEAGRDGFWLARWLMAHGIEVYVIQPSSVPVERRARRAKTDALDVEMLLRATLAWLRGGTAGVLDGADPGRGGGGRPPALARAAGPDPGAAGDHEQDRPPAGPARGRRLPAAPPRPARAPGGAAAARRRAAAGARQGPAGPPPRPARAGARTDPGPGGGPGCRRGPGRGAGRRGGRPHSLAGGPERDRPGAGDAAGLGGVRAAVPRPPGAGRLFVRPFRDRRAL